MINIGKFSIIKIIKHCFLILAFQGLIVLTLIKNMRLETTGSSVDSNLKDFVNWSIKIGDGTFRSDDDKEADIQIPSDFLILESSSPLTNTVKFTYTNFLHNMQNFRLLRIKFYYHILLIFLG